MLICLPGYPDFNYVRTIENLLNIPINEVSKLEKALASRPKGLYPLVPGAPFRSTIRTYVVKCLDARSNRARSSPLDVEYVVVVDGA